jgi:sarcosine oxidase/L-pipecolate oxidase
MEDQSLKTRKIVVIGAGVFGLTTALQLHQRGYTNVTVVDRSMPPVSETISQMKQIAG